MLESCRVECLSSYASLHSLRTSGKHGRVMNNPVNPSFLLQNWSLLAYTFFPFFNPKHRLWVLLTRCTLILLSGLKSSEDALEKMKCVKCNFQAYYEQQYQSHIATHVDDIIKCKACNFVTFEKEDLLTHFRVSSRLKIGIRRNKNASRL